MLTNRSMGSRRASSIRTSLFGFCLVFLGNECLAGDLQSVALQCGPARATIICVKMEAGQCMASVIDLDLANGRKLRLEPSGKIPQNFVTPTIPDGLSCDSSKSGTHYFSVVYSPGSYYASSMFFEFISESGERFSVKALGRLGIISTVGFPLSLREAEQH